MRARRNFTHETDQAKALLSSALSNVETSQSSPGCRCGPAVEGAPEPGPGPRCWALGLCCAAGTAGSWLRIKASQAHLGKALESGSSQVQAIWTLS